MLGISRQVQQVLAFLVLVFIFGGGIMYGRWQHSPKEDTVFLLEKSETEERADITEKSEELKVHVAGAVARPGVYGFHSKGRVEDVLLLAEPLPEADLDALNLAAYLRDEQRIYVPQRSAEGRVDDLRAVGSGIMGERGKVNINTASKGELETLPGVGPTLAQRIIDYRENEGPFSASADIKEVSGIGEKKYQELEALITY